MWYNRSQSFLLQQCRQRQYTFFTVVGLAVILIAFFITYASFSGSKPLPTLRQINVVFRHGDKTPTYSYPNDPHKDFAWKEGKGALTAKGKFELFALGEIMKSKYGEFLGEVYLPEEIQMKSSYAPRAQMSAMTFLAGLFPPKGFQIWNDNLHWQPIPVNPIPRETDNMLAAKAPCAKYEKEKQRSDATIATNLTKEDNDLLKVLTEKTGDQINNIAKAESLFYTLLIQRDNGLVLPDWTEEMFPTKLARFAALNLASYTMTDTLKKFQAGPLLKEIVKNMQMRDGKRKANFYSGHDLTIVSLMRTLGFEDLNLPSYGAAVVIEYHENEDAPGNGFIQVFYHRQATDQKPNSYQLSFCDPSCPLNVFRENLSKFMPNNWEAECKS
ncbi:hypothetical protein GE061_020097 [Apolygus lucorum]|uniref:Acid phosphatase n=1 Tax=Apolygus lucorum TaxID=248454 RepID=A0A6A4J979_APOLU|nr:hypothetical protein GE061_020097 [Apolygus lucorum]